MVSTTPQKRANNLTILCLSIQSQGLHYEADFTMLDIHHLPSNSLLVWANHYTHLSKWFLLYLNLRRQVHVLMKRETVGRRWKVIRSIVPVSRSCTWWTSWSGSYPIWSEALKVSKFMILCKNTIHYCNCRSVSCCGVFDFIRAWRTSILMLHRVPFWRSGSTDL